MKSNMDFRFRILLIFLCVLPCAVVFRIIFLQSNVQAIALKEEIGQAFEYRH